MSGAGLVLWYAAACMAAILAAYVDEPFVRAAFFLGVVVCLKPSDTWGGA